MANITTAASEYANRPADERFASLADLVSTADTDRQHSRESTYNLRDLVAVEVSHNASSTVGLQSPTGKVATFTNYAFGQLARTVGAPASYLRTLPAELAVRNLNHGLKDAAPHGTEAKLLVRATGGTPIIRSATSETYGRVWDGPLYSEVNRYFADGMRSAGGAWQSPPTWSGEPAGQYRGDRDSFVIRIDGGSIVADGRGGNAGGSLHRGLMIRNSEVGHCSVVIDAILFDRICGNHILWGAVIDRTFRRRHVGDRALRDTMRELITIANRFNGRSASQDEAIIRTLMTHEIASTKDGVIDVLRSLKYTKEQATEAYDTCQVAEPAFNPRSYWGIAAGTTRNSQESGYQDDRYLLDSLASAVLARGAKLVTV